MSTIGFDSGFTRVYCLPPAVLEAAFETGIKDGGTVGLMALSRGATKCKDISRSLRKCGEGWQGPAPSEEEEARVAKQLGLPPSRHAIYQPFGAGGVDMTAHRKYLVETLHATMAR